MAEKARLKAIAEESVRLMESSMSAGDALGAALRRAIDRTVTYAPEDPLELPSPSTPHARTEYVVANMRSLQAARQLSESGFSNPAVLNFASAKRPGGGFLNGVANGQEESLSRCSGIYMCIKDGEMYKKNNDRQCLYTHHMMYSPEVPVFRDDGREHEMLGEGWYPASFITAPAVNAGVARKRGASGQEIEATMRERMRRLLAVAAINGHGAIVLGAFGCGVFANEPAMVAALFRELLEGPFAGRFGRVVFAVLDFGKERKLEVFQRAFGGGMQRVEGPSGIGGDEVVGRSDEGVDEWEVEDGT